MNYYKKLNDNLLFILKNVAFILKNPQNSGFNNFADFLNGKVHFSEVGIYKRKILRKKRNKTRFPSRQKARFKKKKNTLSTKKKSKIQEK